MAAAPEIESRVPGDARSYEHLSREELIALLARREREHARIGLSWSHDRAERDSALNDDFVTLRLDLNLSDRPAPWQNLLIEGENFDALRWLRMTMRGRIKAIYADPPYNTGNGDWVYNDRYHDPSDPFFQTAWLEFLHRRFALARDLLTDDGVLLVSINDDNRAVLELMLDKTLPGMRLGSLVWRSRTGSNDTQQGFLTTNHEHILVFGKAGFQFGGTKKSFDRYANPDNDARGDWASDNLTKSADRFDRPNGFYPLTDTTTGILYPPNPDQIWRFVQRGSGAARGDVYIEDLIADGRIRWPSTQRIVTWNTLSELCQAIRSGDVPRSGPALFLRDDLPGLEQYVGVPVGFGTPRLKRFRSELRTLSQPLSSWITPKVETATIPRTTSRRILSPARTMRARRR